MSTGNEEALSYGCGPKAWSPRSLYPECPSRPPGQARTAAPLPRPGGQDGRLSASFAGRCSPSAAGYGGSRGAREPGLPSATGTRKAFSFRNLCVLALPEPWVRCRVGFGQERNGDGEDGSEAQRAPLLQSGGSTCGQDYARYATFGRSRRCSCR